MTLPPFIQKYLPRFRRSADAGRPDPARDWMLLVGFALLALLASVAWSAWFFFEVLKEPTIAPPPLEEAGETGIEAVRAASEARTLEGERYREDYRFVDPSL